MTFRFISQDLLNWLLQAGSPPGDVQSALADPGWAEAIAAWIIDDYYLQIQDPDLDNWGMFIQRWHQGTSLADLYAEFGQRDARHEVEWDIRLQSLFLTTVNGLDPEDETRQQLWDAVVARIEPHYPVFVEDVASVATVSEPQEVVQTPSIDWDYIDQLNEINLKNAAAGVQLDFVQRGEVVLIGSGWPDYYTNWAQGGGQWGNITVQSRGGFASTGEIEVTGAQDQAAFKETLRRFSKKKVTFV